MKGHLWVMGNGFVGSVLAEEARAMDWVVTTVSRAGIGDEHADVADPATLLTLAHQVGEPTHIVHCASASGGGEDAYRKVYLEGCENLATLFPMSHLVFTSSTSVLAQCDGELVDESSETSPQAETGRILVAAEAVVLQARGTVVRLAGVYGEGRCYLLKRFLAGEAEMEEGRILNHTHRRDAASAILHVLAMGDSARGEVYHACDSHPMTQLDTYRALSSRFGLPMPPSVMKTSGSKRGWSNKAVSNAKLVHSGWVPSFPSLVDVADEIAASLGR